MQRPLEDEIIVAVKTLKVAIVTSNSILCNFDVLLDGSVLMCCSINMHALYVMSFVFTHLHCHLSLPGYSLGRSKNLKVKFWPQ